ncbi:DUF4238 domain-containing protein [Aurantiacibacter zhengii]|uniref:DUF4238 domain-containing protein n=1 Tax=Aurantiacibacter zhengii TaxID=2307003 RepID=UPI001313DB99|nr:DUF4238 domain-containing protein [Aurantiacibacter zhengii]
MSVPIDHHYLPQFYLRRWTRGEKLYRYVRPRKGSAIHQKKVTPAAVGYQPHLYAYSDGTDEADRQRLETRFFQLIDDRAAAALAKVEEGQRGTAIDRVGLVQFLLSLLHRSPTRIEHLRDELAERMKSVPGFDASDPAQIMRIADSINDLLSDLISSRDMVPFVAEMRVFRVDVEAKVKLLTCDIPLMQSHGIKRPDAFLMLPYAPNRLLILAHDERVALSFSSQEKEALANAVNDAVVKQARQVVIASNDEARAFIEARFDPFSPPPPENGLLTWAAP